MVWIIIAVVVLLCIVAIPTINHTIIETDLLDWFQRESFLLPFLILMPLFIISVPFVYGWVIFHDLLGLI